MVAGWVGSDRELLWVAPSTEPPLTARKVAAWTRERGNPFLLCSKEKGTPVGYAELNPMRRQKTHFWIGHVIVAPDWRGFGVGVLFTNMLTEHAFRYLGAELMSLIVFPDNQRAIQCYLKAGFGFREEQYHKFGCPAKSCRMLHLTFSRPASTEAT